MKKNVASIPHHDAVIAQLRRRPGLAVEYLKVALDDQDDPKTMLMILRQLAEAHGGVAKVAKAAGIERESLYRVLSPRGNPTLSTLHAIMRAMGLRLTVERSSRSRRLTTAAA